MKNIFVMAVAIIGILGCTQAIMPSATPYTNAEITDQQGKTILVGHCSQNILYREPYKIWYDTTYNQYILDIVTTGYLRSELKTKDISIEIFLGSWCGDSRREVPRMLKVLDAASLDTSDRQLVFVDNSDKAYKQSPQHEEEGKNIFRVPTFIVYENKKEIGRIVETPVASLEKDLLTILEKKNYTPNYRVVPYWQAHVKKRKEALSDDRLQNIASEVRPLSKHMTELNAYGYVLLARKEYGESLNVFRLNTFLYPADSRTYNSLGKACYVAGDVAGARKNYQKALEIKPGDEQAANMLKKIP